ncbi:MAG: hypothetical protein LBT74_04410 [Acidobacteriota bacterium]|jgi:hypothetical protein|nr:hypothetical protein [Acidobacteriota bacterium]
MSMDYSVPLNGFQRAEWSLDKIAQRVAISSSGSDSSDDGKDAIGALAGPDPATDMAMLNQVESVAEANLRAFSAEDELARSLLDVVG